MPLNRLGLVGLLSLIAACSQAAPVTAPATGAAGSASALTMDLGAPNGRTASLSFSPAEARAYQLMAPIAAHHWVAADVYEYDVNLQVRGGTAGNYTYADLATPVNVSLPTSGAGAKTTAVFNNLAQGQYYRAFVTAKGSPGRVDNSTVMNHDATADYGDFDFTAAQNVAQSLDDVVTVHFDSVAFNGSGTVTFASPADGAYANPTSAPTVTSH